MEKRRFRHDEDVHDDEADLKVPKDPEVTESSVPTLRTLAMETWQEVTNLDSRGWRTLKGLALPGRLAKGWVQGNRDEGYPPIRVYLVASALFFLLGTHPSLAALTEASVREFVLDEAVSGLSAPALRSTIVRIPTEEGHLFRGCGPAIPTDVGHPRAGAEVDAG